MHWFGKNKIIRKGKYVMYYNYEKEYINKIKDIIFEIIIEDLKKTTNSLNEVFSRALMSAVSKLDEKVETSEIIKILRII